VHSSYQLTFQRGKERKAGKRRTKKSAESSRPVTVRTIVGFVESNLEGLYRVEVEVFAWYDVYVEFVHGLDHYTFRSKETVSFVWS